MELFKEILTNVLSKEEVRITFPNMKTDVTELVESECYKALLKIKSIIEDDRLSDEECFKKIEKIVCILEDIGSDGGCRHDFG